MVARFPALAVALTLCACSGPEAPSLPAGATHVSLALDAQGFHAAGLENELRFSPQEDVVLHLETAAPLARFSIPSHSVEAMVTAGRPGQLVFRTLGCRRPEPCSFEAVVVVGAGDAVTRGRLLIEPEGRAEANAAEGSAANPAQPSPETDGEGTAAPAGEGNAPAGEGANDPAEEDGAAPSEDGDGATAASAEASSGGAEAPAARRGAPSEQDRLP
ncbi:MAG: hypothetical protein AAF938_18975 [Myxococcota bacterium]